MDTKREPRRLRDLMDDDARHWASMPEEMIEDTCCLECPAFVPCYYSDELVMLDWGFCVAYGDVEATFTHADACDLFRDELCDLRARVAALDALEAAEAEFDARSGR